MSKAKRTSPRGLFFSGTLWKLSTSLFLAESRVQDARQNKIGSQVWPLLVARSLSHLLLLLSPLPTLRKG